MTIAKRPSHGRGTGRSFKDDLPDGQSEIFLCGGLDSKISVDLVREISFLAQAVWRRLDLRKELREPQPPPSGSLVQASLHQRIRMKRALVLSAVLLPLCIPPAFGQAPVLNITALCKARSADARILRSTTGQSLANCEHDEEAAKQQLNTLWASTSVTIRNRCRSEARSLGTTSYLDLVTCIQMADEMKADSKKKTSKE